MKKILLLLAVVFGFQTVSAQEVKTDAASMPRAQQDNIPNRARNEALKAKEKLGLDESQFSKWYQAAFIRLNANKPLFEQLRSSTDNEQKQNLKVQIRENRKKFDSDVNAFLNEDQKVKWAAWKEEKKKELKAKHEAKKQKKAPTTSSPENELEKIEIGD